MAPEAIQTLGGNGLSTSFRPGRLLRDAKLYEIGAGTSEIRRADRARDFREDEVVRAVAGMAQKKTMASS